MIMTPQAGRPHKRERLPGELADKPNDAHLAAIKDAPGHHQKDVGRRKVDPASSAG
jgi:hypothetical protein